MELIKETAKKYEEKYLVEEERKSVQYKGYETLYLTLEELVLEIWFFETCINQQIDMSKDQAREIAIKLWNETSKQA